MKRLERYFKSTFMCLDKDGAQRGSRGNRDPSCLPASFLPIAAGVSAVDPDTYALRFRKRVVDSLLWSAGDSPQTLHLLRGHPHSSSTKLGPV